MSYIFRPPFEKQGTLGSHRLWQFYGLERGISVIKDENGEYYENQYPAQEDLEAAEVYYLGGHEYVVSDEEAADLTAAGYGEFLENV